MRCHALLLSVVAVGIASPVVGQTRSLADLLAVGQQVALGGADGAYAVRIYSPVQKAATIEVYEIQNHVMRRERTPNRSLPPELLDAMRRGDEGARAEILSRGRGFSGRTSFSSLSLPSFYEVSELGADFVALKNGKQVRYIALSGIREVALQQMTPEEEAAQAKFDVAGAHVNALARMLISYCADLGGFPSQKQGLSALVRPPMDLEQPERWQGPYFGRTTISDDPWGHPYRWQVKNEGAVVEVRSNGADEKPDTGDDLVATSQIAVASERDRPFGGLGGFGGGGAVPPGFGAGDDAYRPPRPAEPRPAPAPPTGRGELVPVPDPRPPMAARTAPE